MDELNLDLASRECYGNVAGAARDLFPIPRVHTREYTGQPGRESVRSWRTEPSHQFK